MIMIPAFFLGLLIGAFRSHRKQGSMLDMLQYGFAHGIAFFILGMFISIAFDWQGWV